MFETVYELPLTKNYVASWKMPQAIRELIQNALDSESPFEWSIENNLLSIRSRHTRLSHRTLLLGSTCKAEDSEAIGNFGEGYKIALLVLKRENYNVRMFNGDRLWEPEFRYSKRFDDELLCIVDKSSPKKNQGLNFEIELKGDEDINAVKSSCLQMQDNVGEVVDVKKGQILLDRKGELFVGGLFICTTQLDYSYNIKPEYIKLERDRRTVSSWNLQLVTKEMWFDSERIDQCVELIEKNSPDMYHADVGTPEIVREACYRHFKEKHPSAVIAKDQEELDRMVKSGMTRVVVASSQTHYSVVKSSRGYQSHRHVKIDSPRIVLSKWIKENCPNVPEHARNAILQKAEKWKWK